MLKYILIFIFMFSVSIFSAPETEMEEIPNFACKIIKLDNTKKTITVSIESVSKIVTISIPEDIGIIYIGKNGDKKLPFSELKVNTKLVISSKDISKDINSNKIDSSKIYSTSYIEAFSK